MPMPRYQSPLESMENESKVSLLSNPTTKSKLTTNTASTKKTTSKFSTIRSTPISGSIYETDTTMSTINSTDKRSGTSTNSTTTTITKTKTIDTDVVDYSTTGKKIETKLLKNKISTSDSTALATTAGKKKSKKSKKSDPEKENISVRSSFSKFDALQKKNVLHIRSSDAAGAHEKFNDGKIGQERNCRECGRVVYKMEEVKAEGNIWHRICFRCFECGKQLNVDNYQSHESVFYCKPHFRQLFAPKAVEDNEPVKPKKPEIIIRENQPLELPPDVVRASDKPDLGLDELHQLNVKSRFQVFENYNENSADSRSQDRGSVVVKPSPTILSKLAKFQAKGTNGTGIEYNSSDENESEHDEDDDIDENGEDADLIRAKRAQRERPMSFNNMNDIKTKFENGPLMTREERREERKQEIQNIRSRLFMGKQAKIKEMYQQAVAESEQSIIAAGKKPEIDIGDMARSLKEKFEKGEAFKQKKIIDDDQKLQDEDMSVFEQGIGKKSRSIFMELDSMQQNQQALLPGSPKTPENKKKSQVRELPASRLKPFLTGSGDDIIKCDDKSEDIKIATSEISSKFKFFETYRPTEAEKKQFRITPPRDGVVKMISPEREIYIDPGVVRAEEKLDDPTVAQKSLTASKMLSKFRQMEEDNRYGGQQDFELKPLKRFTPPPDENRRVYNNDSDDDEDHDEDDDEDDGDDEDDDISIGGRPITRYEDEFLKQAQSAQRAKQLRAKFEKWEAHEIRNEMNYNNQNDSSMNLYDRTDENEEGQVESTKSLREKFESLRDKNNSPSRPRVQVNRFV